MRSHHAQQLTASLLALSLVLAPGCSLGGSKTQPVSITATDSSAEIFVDGALVGTGATTVDLEKNKSHAILARVGDRVGTVQIGYKISQTGVLDIVGGILFLIPFLGVFGPSFHELDSTQVTVVLPGGTNADPAFTPESAELARE